MSKVDYVDATFGGQGLRFQLARDDRAIAYLEHAIGSPFAVWRRFAGGMWQVRDVQAVLSFAYPGAKPVLVANVPGIPFPTHEAVAEAMRKSPPAAYVPLVGAILEAFLFGLEADRARFDEAQPYGAAA
jgi:hypothetical protein